MAESPSSAWSYVAEVLLGALATHCYSIGCEDLCAEHAEEQGLNGLPGPLQMGRQPRPAHISLQPRDSVPSLFNHSPPGPAPWGTPADRHSPEPSLRVHRCSLHAAGQAITPSLLSAPLSDAPLNPGSPTLSSHIGRCLLAGAVASNISIADLKNATHITLRF